MKSPRWIGIYLLAILTVVGAVVSWEDAFSTLINADFGLVWLAYYAHYVLTLAFANQIDNRVWAGYVFTSLAASLLTFGLPLTLLMIVTGTGFAFGYRHVFGALFFTEMPRATLLPEFSARLAIGGVGSMAWTLVFGWLGGTTPFTTFNSLTQLLIACFSASAMLAAMYVIGFIIMADDWQTIRTQLRSVLPYDAMALVIAMLLAVVSSNLGVINTAVIVAMLIFLMIRFEMIAQTRDQLHKRVREVASINTIGQAMISNLSLGEVLASVHEQLYELVKPTAVFTALYDENSQILEFPTVDGTHAQKNRKQKLDRGLIDWVLRNRVPLAINMLDSANFGVMGIDIAQIQVQAFLGVPMIVGNKLIGVLGVTHDTYAEAFDATDLMVVSTIAAQASLAIRNASLYNRSVRLSNNLSIINESLQQIMFNLNRESLVEMACLIACQVTDTEKSAVFLVQERMGLHLVANKGIEGCLPADFTMAYRPDMYRSGSRTVYNVQTSEDAALRALGESCGFISCLEVPLRSNNTLMGVIAVYHDTPHVYEVTDISLLEMLANQVTAAFDNTDLLQALELYASEQAQLVHLSRITTSNLDLERVILDVSVMLMQIVDMEHIDITIFNSNDAIDVYHTETGETLERGRMSIGDLPEMKMVMENPQLANPYMLHIEDSNLTPATRAFMAKRGDLVLALLPLKVSSQVFGILILGSTRHPTLVDNTRRLLEMAIHQVSAQIHNARIYTITEEALSQQLEQLSLIEDIAQKISQSLRPQVIIENVLDASIRATQADSAELALINANNQWRIIRQVGADAPFTMDADADHINRDLYETYTTSDIVTSTGDGRSSMAVPLMSGDRPLGVLRVMRNQEEFFDQEHANFIRSVAGHAAISIDNAMLLEERQYQVNTLTDLRRLTLDVVGNVDEKHVTDAILRTTLLLLGATEVSLYGYDAHSEEIVPMAGLRTVGDVFEEVEPRHAPQPIYQAIQQREVVNIDAGVTPEYDSQGNLVYPTVVAIPIIRHQTIREVIVVGYERPHLLQNRDYATIDQLSAQIASHLENVRLNQTISTSNNRMRAILDSTHDGVVLLDNAGRVQEANLCANDYLGMPLDQHYGESLYRLLQTNLGLDDRALLDFASTITVDMSVEPREIAVVRHESPLYLELTVVPVRDTEHSNTGRLLSIRDITEQKQLANTRDSLQRMLLHDLRSPMAAIITGLSLIQVLIEDIDHEVTYDLQRTVEASMESGNNLLRLMETLRDIPRMKDIVIEPMPISIHTLATKAYESLEILFKEALITFETRIAKDEILMVDVDLMRRVLINLLHNALKFTPEGGTILVAADADPYKPHFLRVRVCDTGPGIPPNMRERIFNEFQQVEGQLPKRGGRGTGLGLTLCKLAVEAHGGEIHVDPDGLLSGACFAFILPLTPVAEQALA